MKISVRLSIICLFAVLLSIVGTCIIIINYKIANKISLDSAENLFTGASELIESRLDAFFIPVKQRIKHVNFIKNGFVHPGPSKEFTDFLLHNIIDLSNVDAAYWVDARGNFYFVGREESKSPFIYERGININGKFNSVIRRMDQNGRFIGEVKHGVSNYDPRKRPWYVKAEKAKKPTFSDVYLFTEVGEDAADLGITYAYPVYGRDHKLQGMFALDVNLRTITESIVEMRNTPNTKIFLFDSALNLIASSDKVEYRNNILPKMANIPIPLANISFDEYRKHKVSVFYYKLNSVKYLAFYSRFLTIPDDNWYIAITLPTSDITAALDRQVLLAIFIAIGILLLGLLWVWLISDTIARPIIQLANETGQVSKKLDFAPSSVESRIEEIVYMRDAFNAMKQNLHSFARYLPIALVKNLIASGDIAHVGGENKKVTFLFVDITGFTSLSEKMSPHKLMVFLSEYFEIVTKIIIDRKGTVDKYIGDAVMAFWGAPLDDNKHVSHACQAALMICEATEALSQKWLSICQTKLAIRVGINTGTAIIGNVGSNDRLSYTAIGDSVNVANRLEALNKGYKTTIIASHATYQLVKEQFKFRLLDYVAVRGKDEGTYVYELLSENNQFGSGLKMYVESFKKAFAYYEQGQWSMALEGFQELANLYPYDNLITIYIKRCKHFMSNPPESWDGMWRFVNESIDKDFTIN